MRTALLLWSGYLGGHVLLAQVGPPPASLSLTSVSQQSAQVPVGTSPTILNITVDSAASGTDKLDVIVGDPSERATRIGAFARLARTLAPFPEQPRGKP